MSTPKGPLNYASTFIHNQQNLQINKHRKNIFFHSEIRNNKKNQSFRQQEDSIHQSPERDSNNDLFGMSDMDQGNLQYINSLLQRDKSRSKSNNKQKKEKQNESQSRYKDSNSPQLSSNLNEQKSDMKPTEVKKSHYRSKSTINQSQSPQNDQILQKSCDQSNLQYQDCQNEKLFGQFFDNESKNEECDELFINQIQEQQQKDTKIQMQDLQQSQGDTNYTNTYGSIQKQDDSQNDFIKTIDNYLEYHLSSSEQPQSQQQNILDKSLHKTPQKQNQYQQEMAQITQENIIFKKQIDHLQKQLKELNHNQKQLFQELTKQKTREQESKKIIKIQNSELKKFKSIMTQMANKLEQTQEDLSREKINHENTVLALNQLLNQRQNQQQRKPKVSNNYLKYQLKESKSHNANHFYPSYTPKYQIPDYFGTDSSIYDSDSHLAHLNIGQQTQEEELSDSEFDFEVYQQAFMKQLKNMKNLKKKHHSNVNEQMLKNAKILSQKMHHENDPNELELLQYLKEKHRLSQRIYPQQDTFNQNFQENNKKYQTKTYRKMSKMQLNELDDSSLSIQNSEE